MNKKQEYICANLLKQQFNVSNPFDVLCFDCTKLSVTLEDNVEQKTYYFVESIYALDKLLRLMYLLGCRLSE